MTGGAALWHTNDFDYYKINVYKNGAWHRVTPWVYTNGKWTRAGGGNCLMIEWYDKNGNLMVDSNGNTILVRDR